MSFCIGMVRRLAGISVLLFALVIMAPAAAAEEQSGDIGRQATDVDFEWGVKIPMRDGFNLNATLYRPKGWSKPMPAVVTITPYISDRYHPDAQYLARHGFAFIIVDSRGRGNSEGEFTAFLQEAEDGHDVIEWLARQPWSNGKLAMRGGSYSGYNQWATVKEFPKHLTSIVPVAAAYAGLDFPMQHNIPAPYALRWTTLTSGVTPNGRAFGDDPFWTRKSREYHVKHLPFRKFDELVGNVTTDFATWVDHPELDAYWDAMSPTDEEFARIDMPILTITGYYDGDQIGAMEYYRKHMALAPRRASNKHYLLIGPWNHGGTRFPKAEFGGIKLGDKSLFDAWGLDKDWYNWTLGSGKRPEFLLDKVTYFVTGANEWKSAPSLEAIADEELTLQLGSSGKADSLFASGSLSAAQPEGGSETDSYAYDSYSYDPMDTSFAERESSDDYITDQLEVTVTDGNGLIYHSAPFDEATEITGYLKFEAWIALDVPDTDIIVSLYEVLEDGSSIALTYEMQRARYRTSRRAQTLITPGEINLYTFSDFRFFSRRIAKGSRLRLFIRGPQSVHSMRNYNSGGVVADETAEDARVANVTLYHDAEHPSRLILPVVSGD